MPQFTLRSKLRLAVLTLLLIAGGSYAGYRAIHNRGKAEDLTSFQGVDVCSTSRDNATGTHRCPGSRAVVTSCEEAKAAVTAISGIILHPEVTQVGTQPSVECELRAVSRDEHLYALVVHAYYAVDTSATDPLVAGRARADALSKLYATYTNLYQSYLALDLTTTPATQGLAQAATFQSFTPAFLIWGDPGFRMHVSVQDQDGKESPGAGTLIRMSCGGASDTMVAEPNGNSWFSFEGYEKLNCGTTPLTAQAMVQRDLAGDWIKDTPSYNLAYEPTDAAAIDFQNKPQDPALRITGKWQGIGVQVAVSDGGSLSLPLAGTAVRFTCNRPAPPSGGQTAIERSTDVSGRARVAMAEARTTLAGCGEDQFLAVLSAYDQQTGGAKDDPAYDYYFPQTDPLPAGRFSGTERSGGLLEGRQITVSGRVRIADIGKVSGGFLTAGNTVCLFYSDAAANATAGCPADAKTATSQTVKSDSGGRYAFGTSADTRISYGDYKAAGSGPMTVRILNYKGDAYPVSVVAGNAQPWTPDGSTNRDITLASGQSDLQDYVCQTVRQLFGGTGGCDAMDNIIFRESRWDVAATNKSSGACGLFQANPCSKYRTTALADEDYKAIGNQIRWGINYVKGRYGTPQAAWAFWQKNGHY